jgi:hypothetical protein
MLEKINFLCSTMDLLAVSTTKKITSAKDAICNALQGLSRDEQLSRLVDFFQAATERDTQLTELIAEAWDYLNIHTLWNTRYSSIEVADARPGIGVAIRSYYHSYPIPSLPCFLSFISIRVQCISGISVSVPLYISTRV